MARCSSADAAGERIGAGDDDAAAHAEQEHQEQYRAESRRAGQEEERDGDAGEAENEADLVALGIEQRPDAERGDDETERLRKSDGAVLRGGEVETLREVGQNGAQHGGDHSIDEDGENGGEDQHGTGILSIS